MDLAAAQQPHIVLILADDLGAGDVGPRDHDGDPLTTPVSDTPQLDLLMQQGLRATQCSASSPLCSPSRASLLTGRHHARTGVSGVLFPESSVGLPAGERTLAECLRDGGYRTALVGKWHLGNVPGLRPWEQGFESFYGVLNSNDMAGFALMENDLSVQSCVDQDLLHAALFQRARETIAQAAGGTQPLFLMLSLVTPHVPVHVHPSFQGSSGRGLYADALRELDAGVGSIVSLLQSLNLDANTLLIFSSDNGPWIQSHGPPAGHPEPWRWVGGQTGGLRGAKGTAYEGGVRVPLLLRQPGTITAEVRTDPVSLVDIFPTLLARAGLPLPGDRRIDGRNLLGSAALRQAQRRPVEQCVYRMFHADTGLWGTRRLWSYRNERWKLFFDNQGNPTECYDLLADPAETTPLANSSWLSVLADRARQFHCRLDELPLTLPAGPNLALGAQAFASASQACSTAELCCDGRPSTGYESPATAQGWLMLDLGAVQPLAESQLAFGAAFPTQYRLEHSLDGGHWQTFALENAGQGGTVRHGLSAQARFVRLQASSTAGGAGLCVLEWRLLARPSGPGGAGGSDSVGG
jgi:arylsulfatase A-like enzyme